MPYEKSSPSSPEAQSASPIQDNLKALAALFPSVVRDGQVDVDALRQLCGEAVVKEDELFGLNWRGKAEARRAALAPSLGTLRPCTEESKDWDTTQNLYIEGDNLEVLKLLRKSYGGRVKMIYIDPPYNTGKEFVYPDDYQNGIENYKKLTGQEGKFAANIETSGRFHTTWLNMMYPRLVLARDLLREDGVIFVSIDDNEAANLVKICSEIFGERNFVGNIIWQSRTSISNDDEISTNHNHTLVYSKNRDLLTFGGDEIDASEYVNPDNDPRGPWKLVPIDANHVGGDTNYPIRNPKTGVDYYPPNGRIWCYNQQTLAALMEDGRIKFGLSDDSSPKRKLYLNERKAKGDCKTPSSILLDAGTTKSGTNELMELFDDEKVFDYPKPTTLIMRLIKYGFLNDDDLIFDFFSGSGTTAHAVYKYNLDNESKIRFILVQLPENLDNLLESAANDSKKSIRVAINVLDAINKAHYLTEIGKERIRRAGEKVKEEAGLAGQNLDIGFRVYKLDSSNVKAWNPQEEDLVEAMSKYAEHLVGGRTEDDFLTEIMLKSGIDLVEEVQEREIAGHRVQSLGYGQYYACMAADLADDAEDVALGIAAWHEEDCAFAGGEQQDTCTVFVSDRAFASNDAAKMNFVAILEQHGICNIKAL